MGSQCGGVLTASKWVIWQVEVEELSDGDTVDEEEQGFDFMNGRE